MGYNFFKYAKFLCCGVVLRREKVEGAGQDKWGEWGDCDHYIHV